MTLDLAAIRAARERIAGKVHVTPVMSASRVGDVVGVRLVLKCENLRKTGSYKVRGALNKLSQLDGDARARGVVTVSAGNHAQAVAWSSRAAGISATVVMPENATKAKVDASRGYGAEVVLHGASSLQAFDRAHQLEAERHLTFVHPFDDEWVCAGAGTVGLELLEQAPELDVVVVPIGGGGLIAGMLVALKESNPRIRVYGVEPTGAPSMWRSVEEGHAVRLDAVKTIADGLAAPMAGELNYDVVRRYADDVVLVDDKAMTDAMSALLLSAKLLAEPAGAADRKSVV